MLCQSKFLHVLYTINQSTRAYYASIREKIASLVDEVIRPNAARTDEEGVFPRENLEALIKAG